MAERERGGWRWCEQWTDDILLELGSNRVPFAWSCSVDVMGRGVTYRLDLVGAWTASR